MACEPKSELLIFLSWPAPSQDRYMMAYDQREIGGIGDVMFPSLCTKGVSPDTPQAIPQAIRYCAFNAERGLAALGGYSNSTRFWHPNVGGTTVEYRLCLVVNVHWQFKRRVVV